jgi:hypothetical protein
MESVVKFRDRQELQSADLNNIQEFTQASIDHVILDAIENGRAYSGFDCSKTGAAEITVDPGRYYALGEVFARDESVVLDCFNVLPLVTKKRVAVVVWGQDVETDVQPRDFLVDATTGSTEPQSVAMEVNRHAELNIVAGVEAADPVYPTTDANVTVVAYALLDTNGIVSIEQWTATQVLNLREVGDRTGDLEDWQQTISSRVDTLGTDLAALAARLGSFALQSDLMALAMIVQGILAKLATNPNPPPATYLYHGLNRFTNNDDSETGASGYECLISQGLRFPHTAETEVTLALLNPTDPLVILYGGHCMPYHVHKLRHDCKHYHWHHRCSLHTWHPYPMTKLELSRHRWRCGPEWCSTIEAWELKVFAHAMEQALHDGMGSWNSLTYQAYINNLQAMFGAAWWRTNYVGADLIP